MIVELKDICKSYMSGSEELQVLKNVCLEVDKGEFLAILGVSGSGKSTLMNILGGMDTCDNGSYCLDDIDITNYNDAKMGGIRNAKIGFIFQRYQLIPQYSILQNVIMPLLIRGKSRKEAIEIAKKYIELVGLSDRISHRPSELSGGQQQRVAIARALVTTPSLLLADEPTGALDSKTSQEILGLFKELNALGNTIIMITHDLNVAKHSKRILTLNDGVLNQDSLKG